MTDNINSCGDCSHQRSNLINCQKEIEGARDASGAGNYIEDAITRFVAGASNLDSGGAAIEAVRSKTT